MQIKKETAILGTVWLFLCCYFMQILGFPNILTVFLGAGLCLVLVIEQKCLRIDVGLILLAITMLSYYGIANGIRGVFYLIAYIPLIFYILGNYMAYHDKDGMERSKLILVLIAAVVIGYTIHGILNSCMFFAGYKMQEKRHWFDFWKQTYMPGTQQIVLFLPVLAMFVPAVLYITQRKWLGVFTVLATMFFCYTSLATRSRMSIVIFAIVFVMQIFIFILFEGKIIKKIISSKKAWALIAIIVFLLTAVFFVIKDTSVVGDFIYNFGKDGGILNNIRFTAQRQALSQLFTYPMGGMQMDLILEGYCHNTWLDMANESGLIPFFAFAAYTVVTLYETVCFVRVKGISTEAKLIVLGMYASFFLLFTVEPALEASVHLTTPWFFTNGITHGMLQLEKKKEITNG